MTFDVKSPRAVWLSAIYHWAETGGDTGRIAAAIRSGAPIPSEFGSLAADILDGVVVPRRSLGGPAW